MRYFCSTITKPSCKNRVVLAHNALPEQSKGTEERNESSSLFLFNGEAFYSYAIGENKYPRDNLGGIM